MYFQEGSLMFFVQILKQFIKSQAYDDDEVMLNVLRCQLTY